MPLLDLTEYILPNGRKESRQAEISEEHMQKAQQLIDAGYAFEYEFLRTNDCSATLADHKLGEDVAIELMFFRDAQKLYDEGKAPSSVLFEQLIDSPYKTWEGVGRPKAGEGW